MLARLETAITRFWYHHISTPTLPRWQYGCIWLCCGPVLLPLSLIVHGIARKRRQRIVRQYRQDQPHANSLPPIVVVGNISVGGTGKTPLILALSARLQQEGLKVGIISRGYGAEPPHVPFSVTRSSPIEHSGDEPKMLALLSDCPVVIDPVRRRAARALHKAHEVDVILSDDGLQHIGLPRAIEIVVCDGLRQFGNGLCLPAGPLREPLTRLHRVDFIAQTGREFSLPLPTQAPVALQTLKPSHWVNVATGETRPLNQLASTESITAVTGIGNPDRFFSSLSALGLSVKPVSYPDHYRFKAVDFAEFADNLVIMTAKDAVKCQAFAQPNWWYLHVEALLPEAWYQLFLNRLAAYVSYTPKRPSAAPDTLPTHES